MTPLERYGQFILKVGKVGGAVLIASVVNGIPVAAASDAPIGVAVVQSAVQSAKPALTLNDKIRAASAVTEGQEGPGIIKTKDNKTLIVADFERVDVDGNNFVFYSKDKKPYTMPVSNLRENGGHVNLTLPGGAEVGNGLPVTKNNPAQQAATINRYLESPQERLKFFTSYMPSYLDQEAMPLHVIIALADAAYHHGPKGAENLVRSTARILGEEDLNKAVQKPGFVEIFHELRRKKLNDIADKNPKHEAHRKGWNGRVRGLERATRAAQKDPVNFVRNATQGEGALLASIEREDNATDSAELSPKTKNRINVEAVNSPPLTVKEVNGYSASTSPLDVIKQKKSPKNPFFSSNNPSGKGLFEMALGHITKPVTYSSPAILTAVKSSKSPLLPQFS